MNNPKNVEEKIFELLDEIKDSETLISVLNNICSKVDQRLEANNFHQNYETIDSVLVKTIQRIEDLRHKNEDISGVPSGFVSLDRVTYGFQNTDLIVIASRPSVGKTAFALNLARNAALHPTKPTPVAFFSLEMSAGQLVQRILSAESEIWLEKISRGKMEEHEMKQLYARGIQKLSQASLFIDDSPRLNISKLIDRCRFLKYNHNIGLIIVDYLQLMNGIVENANREQDLSLITRELKALAKELQIPIIALSQLSRETERRREGNKMPQLSDLRDSGAIEQDADMVMFLYRPEYYDITQDEMGDNNRGETHVRIAKHRNGSLETIKLRALLHIQKFVEDAGDIFQSFQNWKPAYSNETAGARMFIATEGKMNDLPDDEYPF